jgi:hypothetical protein
VRHHRVLTSWETEFAYTLARYKAPLSARQLSILAGLLSRAVLAER